MESVLFYIVFILGVSTVLNLVLKRIGVSQIIGYIMTGTIVVYLFDLKDILDSNMLEHIGEFGIVFLMFTIGLEISLAKMNTMKQIIFVNGPLQVLFTAFTAYMILHYLFHQDLKSSLIIALAVSLSSTAIVLSYLKSSKDIYSIYGRKSTGILIFQDIAVIPILILIGILSNESDKELSTILLHTVMSAFIVLGFMFVIGKRFMAWLLHFSASSEVDELFMASVLFIVISASLLANFMGFTYSLGAFVAGMVIAETRYHHKVESDIAPFKDILLGIFFVVVGMKVDIGFFLDNIGLILGIFSAILLIKTLVAFVVLRFTSDSSNALKTALALSQVGEFSFVIFAIASMNGILDKHLTQLLVLIVILSMIITPFFIAKVKTIASFIIKEKSQVPEVIAMDKKVDHIIVCGYSVVGKFVAKYLDSYNVPYIIIDNNPKYVLKALRDGKEAYLGDMSKRPILDALSVKDSSAVIVTLDNMEKKRLICEAVLKESRNINLIVKVVSLQEKERLKDLDISMMVDGKQEVARVLVEKTMTCQLKI